MGRYWPVVVIVLLVMVRFLNLEMDPPAYNQSGINVTDEPYYCVNAINDFNESRGAFLPEFHDRHKDFLYVHNEGITYLSLLLLGNNYVGLRMPVVLLSICVLLLLAIMLSRILQREYTYVLLLLALAALDYYFFQFSRYQTPQIYSIFWLTVVSFLAFKSDERPVFGPLAVCVAFMMIALVYPYMIFMGIALPLWFLSEAVLTKRIQGVFQSVYGLLAGLLGVFLVLWVMDFSLADYLHFFTQRMEIRSEVGVSKTTGLLARVLQIPYTNLFRYNPILFIGSGLFLVQIAFSFKSSTRFERYLFFSLISIFVAAVFVTSYPFKKWVMALPFAYMALGALMHRVLSKKVHGKWISLGVVGVFGLLNLQSVRVNNAPAYWSGFAESYPIEALSSVFQLLLFGLVALTVIASAVVCLVPNYRKVAVMSMLVIGVLVQGAFTLNYVFTPTYKYKERLVEIKPEISDKVIIGDFSHAYAFYTDAKPTFNPYAYSFEFITREELKLAFSDLPQQEQVCFLRKNLYRSEDSASAKIFHFNLDKQSEGIFTLYQ